MPILWRHLLSQYLKVLFLSTAALIALLLTIRLGEIAHLATLAPRPIYVLYFALYQIPYILPIALPISGLISAILLFQRLSKHRELTALRAAGFSLSNLLTPLLLTSAFLAIGNFYITSELATDSHLSASLIKNEVHFINPLLLLNNKHLMKLKGIHFDAMGPSRLGESASHVVISMPSSENDRMNLLLAENLQTSTTSIKGTQISLISSLPPKKNEKERLFVENIKETDTSLNDFSQMIQKKMWNLNNDHLRMPLLLERLDALQKAEGSDALEAKQLSRNINRIYAEIIRRISLSLAVITFTLLGASCGIAIGRNRSNKGLFLVVILSALYIFAYTSAKSIDHLLTTSLLFYTIPHLLILLFSFWMLNRAKKGIE